VIGGIAIVSVGAALAYFLSPSSSSPRKKRSAALKLSKYKKSFEGHPFGIVWACDEEFVGFYVAADQKNLDLGLKIGSMLVKVGDQRVAGETAQSLTEILRRVKDFPIELQFLEQPKLEEAWTNSQTHRSNGKNLFKEQKYAEALLEYDEAIKLHPTLKLLHSNKVLCLLKLEQFEMALQASHDMLRLDPYYPKGHYLKGSCHLEVGKRAEKSQDKALSFSHAISELRTCLRKQPENQPALAKLKESEKLQEEIKAQMQIELEKEIAERKKAREQLMEKWKNVVQNKEKEESEGNAESTPAAVGEDVKIEDAAKEDTEEAKENSEELKPAENADSVAIVDATAEMQKEDERPADLIEPAEETVEPAKASEKPAELTIDSDEQQKSSEYVIVTPRSGGKDAEIDVEKKEDEDLQVSADPANVEEAQSPV